MLVICPECSKKLNVAETRAGKKVRCPGCKTAVPVPAEQITATPAPPRREAEPAESAQPRAPARKTAVPSAVSTMRCAACKVAALQPLPPNAFSRRPGYVCSECGKLMRPPGTTATYVVVVFLGAFVFLISAAGAVAILFAEGIRKPAITGTGAGIALGASATIWAIRQLTRPIPLDAPRRPIRIGVVLVLLLIVLLLACLMGAGVFGVMYLLHEM